MKLPKEMPVQLVGLIVDKVFNGAIEDINPIIETYKVIIDYYTLEHDFWISVDKPPEKYSRVWIKNNVTSIEAFFTDGEFRIDDAWHESFFSDYPPTHWQYYEIPSMLTIAEQSRINDLYLNEKANDRT